MIYHGKTVSTTPGVAVPLSTQNFKCSFLTIFPRSASGTANTGEVRVGGMPTSADNVALNGVTTAIPSGTGMPLSPGDAGVVWPVQAVNPIALNTVYLDVDTSGDGVQFIYGRP